VNYVDPFGLESCDACSMIDSISNKIKSKYKDLTAWHFEGRDALNKTVSYSEANQEGSQWTRLSTSESVFHDNGKGKPEIKFIHPQGYEVVFDGDTHELITDPKYKGTFNYCNPKPFKEVTDVSSFLEWAKKGVKHFRKDVLPYLLGGNVRGEN